MSPLYAGPVNPHDFNRFVIQLPENENAVIVEKDSQMLYVVSNGSGSDASPQGTPMDIVFSAPCSTGEVSGPKVKKGDKRTPEGIYFLTDEFEDKYLTPVYGKKAFPTDYPNFIDRRQGKNGSAIWIHGTDKELKPMDSNGCVALENKNVLALSRYITLDSTPLIIVDTLSMAAPLSPDREKEQILSLVRDWVKAIERGSYHQYLSFYAPSYVPDISWWEQWLVIRNQFKKDEKQLTVLASSTGIYRHGNLCVVLMDFGFSFNGKKVDLGKRKLFFETIGQETKIIGDVYQKKNQAYATVNFPLVAASQNASGSRPDHGDVLETVKAWLAAWSAKDMDAYAQFYAPEFYGEGMSKTEWVNRKKALAGKYARIHVTGKNFKIIKKKDGVEVRFFQNYKSSGFSTKGIKQLKLVNKGGAWKISQENWKGK